MSNFNLSSNPLTTLYPNFSPQQQPNYNNAFKVDLSRVQSNTMPFNQAQQFQQSTAPMVNDMIMKVGLATSTSSNPAIAYKGQQMVNEASGSDVTPINGEGESGEAGRASVGSKLSKFFSSPAGIMTTGLADIAGAFLPEKDEYSGAKGELTQTLDTAYDNIANAAMAIPGIGAAVGGLMKLGSFGSKAVNALGGGTDGMCVCAGTKVYTAKGKIVNIEDLKKEDGIIGWSEETKQIAPQTIHDFIEPRQKECVRIELENGITLDCSYDHPIYTLTLDWKFIPASKLIKRSVVGIINNKTKQLELTLVKSVVPIGIQTVYNLQADNDHTYLANGIITHNTTADAILGSSFLSLTPIGLINGFGGAKASTIKKNEQAFETVGSSYTGTESTVNDSLSKSGKKYGLFSSRARRKANDEIQEAKRQQNIMTDIADEATKRKDIVQSMAAINGNRRALRMQGGYDPTAVRAGKSGMSIELINEAKKIVSQYGSGGTINQNPTEILIVEPDTIQEFQSGGSIKKSRTLDELIKYAKERNPRFVQRMSEPRIDIEFVDKKGNTVKGTHYMAWGTDDNGNAIVYPTIMEDDEGKLKYYGDSAFQRAINKKDYLIMTPDEAELFTNSGEDENGNLYGYKVGWPDFFKPIFKRQKGGTINVIPDGALHARKHNIDMEGITKKGIPVVDNDGQQQAEVEREEIIFRLEVTKQLEELTKRFYSDDTTDKEKDDVALEAGKLLVNEILYNTQDNTNLINQV